MEEELIIEDIINSFELFNIRDIKEINSRKQELDYTIAVFILCSCLIDQLSGFRYATRKVGNRYRMFVKDYLPKYDPEKLYDDLRNKLVHNYSLGNHYGLSRHRLPISIKSLKCEILVLDDFILDLENCFNRYKNELRTDKIIKANAIKWYKDYKIVKKLDSK